MRNLRWIYLLDPPRESGLAGAGDLFGSEDLIRRLRLALALGLRVPFNRPLLGSQSSKGNCKV